MSGTYLHSPRWRLLQVQEVFRVQAAAGALMAVSALAPPPGTGAPSPPPYLLCAPRWAHGGISGEPEVCARTGGRLLLLLSSQAAATWAKGGWRSRAACLPRSISDGDALDAGMSGPGVVTGPKSPTIHGALGLIPTGGPAGVRQTELLLPDLASPRQRHTSVWLWANRSAGERVASGARRIPRVG